MALKIYAKNIILTNRRSDLNASGWFVVLLTITNKLIGHLKMEILETTQ